METTPSFHPSSAAGPGRRPSGRRRITRGTGILGIAALALTACGGSSDAESSNEGGDGAPETLTVTTFNEFGYEELFEEYEELTGITIQHNKVVTAENARDSLRNSLGAGSGASDIAYTLDTHLRARTFWRMGVLLPYVVTPAAVSTAGHPASTPASGVDAVPVQWVFTDPFFSATLGAIYTKLSDSPVQVLLAVAPSGEREKIERYLRGGICRRRHCGLAPP